MLYQIPLHRQHRRWQNHAAAALFTIVLAACPGGGDGTVFGQPDAGGLTITEPVVECPTAESCSVDAPHNYVADPATVDSVLRSLTNAGCQRFQGDCAYLCDSPFYACAPTVAQCVADQTKSRLADLNYPVIDPFLGAECLTDLNNAACSDIPPDTAACNLVLLEGCPDDSDNLGAPYSWAAAAALTTLPAEFSVYLCEDVHEWLSLDLKKGDIVSMQAAEPEPSFGNLRVELLRDDPSQSEPDYLDSERMNWAGDDPMTFPPVDVAGRYFLSLRPGATMALTLRVSVEQAAPVQ